MARSRGTQQEEEKASRGELDPVRHDEDTDRHANGVDRHKNGAEAAEQGALAASGGFADSLNLAKKWDGLPSQYKLVFACAWAFVICNMVRLEPPHPPTPRQTRRSSASVVTLYFLVP